MRSPRTQLAVALLVIPLLIGAVACSSDDSAEGSSAGDRADQAGSGQPDDATKSGDSTGAGSATLTLDGETWSFDQVRCAFGEDEIGVEGAEFNMAARDGQISLYAAIDPGHSYIELADLDAMGDDDGLEWSTQGADGDPVIEISGKSASSTATFANWGPNGEQTMVEGTFEATCP